MLFPGIMTQIKTAQANSLIAIFTVVLAVATIAYVVISAFILKSLNKQVKELKKEVKQSRNVFLTDVVLRVIQMTATQTGEVTRSYIHGLRHVLDSIEPKLGHELVNLFETFVQKAAKKRRAPQK